VRAIVFGLLAIGCGSPMIMPGPDAGASDSGQIQGDSSMPMGDAAMPMPGTGPVLYPAGQRHSPMPPDVIERLREIARSDQTPLENVFAKVGDSITVDTHFMHCFGTASSVNFDGRTDLDSTLAFFGGGDAAGTDPYRRTSLAATVGWSASAAIAGSPSPLDRELTAIHPRFGVLMFGTNDVGFRELEAYSRDMLTIVDRMIAGGTIPLMTSIPPRDDDAAADVNVPVLNLALRAIAQGRAIPFVDYHRELMPLPLHGLTMADRLHPQAYSMGSCIFTDAGLQFGVNVRNLITLEQLDRAHRALLGDSIDASAPRLQGDGSASAPFEITALPFAVMGDTTRGARTLEGYACGTQNESGPEQRYRLVLPEAAVLSAFAISSTGADIDIHLLDDTGTPAGCLARDNRVLTVAVDAGTYYLVADTFVSTAGEQPGEYLLIVYEE
jgi:hypothetical protein